MKLSILPLALLVLAPPAFAQVPGAGGQLLQIPPSPAAPRAAPPIRIEQRSSEPEAAIGPQLKVMVRSLRISGASVFTEAQLLELAGFVPGRELTLGDLKSMAARITEHYRRNGYFVAQAYLPAQDIKDDAVTIAVSEGRYGQVTLRNRSTLSDRVARDALQEIHGGDVIAAGPLESRLLMLADTPGVRVQSTLVPGRQPGTSDLVVDIDPGPAVSGSIDADNAGSRYTGVYRAGATVNFNDPLGLGDVASLRLLTSGSGLKYARLAYQLPVGRAQVGAAYSMLEYSLGREFAPLQAHGTARIASVFARYPLLRSRDDNVYAQLAFDAKTFHDQIDSVPSVTDRKSGVLMASLFGDHRDGIGAGGVSSYGLTVSAGHLDIETPSARAADAITARTNGHFNKFSFSAMRLQRLGGPFSLYAALSGQVASKNLDVSEKMELGGVSGVRAYPEGEAYADQGVLLTVEGRMDLTPPSNFPGQLQLIAFADTGSVTIDRQPWTTGSNHRHLSGAGVGLQWWTPGDFSVRVQYAHKLGSAPATSAPDSSHRFWVQLVKYF